MSGLTAESAAKVRPAAPSVPPQRRWPIGRVACLALGPVLLVDGLILMGMGLFTVGVTVPGALGLMLCALAWRWHAVHAWLARFDGANAVACGLVAAGDVGG